MPERYRSTDPRGLGGEISGPGGPHDKNAVVVDLSHAVLVDTQEVALVALGRDGDWTEKGLALRLEGRINKTQDRAAIMFLLNGDGAAALVTELVGLARREGAEFAAEFIASMAQRQREAL